MTKRKYAALKRANVNEGKNANTATSFSCPFSHKKQTNDKRRRRKSGNLSSNNQAHHTCAGIIQHWQRYHDTVKGDLRNIFLKLADPISLTVDDEAEEVMRIMNVLRSRRGKDVKERNIIIDAFENRKHRQLQIRPRLSSKIASWFNEMLPEKRTHATISEWVEKAKKKLKKYFKKRKEHLSKGNLSQQQKSNLIKVFRATADDIKQKWRNLKENGYFIGKACLKSADQCIPPSPSDLLTAQKWLPIFDHTWASECTSCKTDPNSQR